MNKINKEKLLLSFNKMSKESMSNIVDLVVFLSSLVLGAVAMDFDLYYLKAISGFLFFLECMWFICSFITLIVTEIIIRKRNKKSNIEKLIDEEIRKEEN